MEFGTVDRVEMVLYEEADVIHQYITESPDRVILATWGACVRAWAARKICCGGVVCGWWMCDLSCSPAEGRSSIHSLTLPPPTTDEELVKRQGRDVFRLTTKPLQFITLSLQPSIDVKVSTGEQALWVESLAHSMNGAERLLGQSFAESLKIEVKGKLHAVPGKQGPGLTTLVGDVQLFTSGQLPLLFSLTPRPVLETAAVAINRRIMGYAKGKFVENLARDFDAWAAASASSSRKQPPPQQQQRKAAG